MKVGDGIRDRKAGWAGTIANIFLISGDGEPLEVDEVDTSRDHYTMVIELMTPGQNGQWMTMGPMEPGDVAVARLN